MTTPYLFPASYGEFRRNDELTYRDGEVEVKFGLYVGKETQMLVNNYGRTYDSEAGGYKTRRELLGDVALAAVSRGQQVPDEYETHDVPEGLVAIDDSNVGIWASRDRRVMMSRFLWHSARGSSRNLVAYVLAGDIAAVIASPLSESPSRDEAEGTAALVASPISERDLGRLVTPITPEERQGASRIISRLTSNHRRSTPPSQVSVE